MAETDLVFLIGNGPSGKRILHEKLRSFETVVVNQFFFSQALITLEPKYWLLVDPAYWTEQVAFEAVLEGIRVHQRRNVKINIVAPPPLCTLLGQLVDNNLTLTEFDIFGGEEAFFRVQQSGFDLNSRFPALCQSVFTAGLMFCAGLKKQKIALIGYDFDTWYPKDKVEFERTLDTHIYDDDCIPEVRPIKEKLGAYIEAKKSKAGSDYVAHQQNMERLEWQIKFIYEVCRRFGIEIVNLNQESLVPFIPKIADRPLFFL